MTLARPLIVRLRVDLDDRLSEGFDLPQLKKLARGATFMGCYRGVRVGDRIFTSFAQLETEMVTYAAHLEARALDAGALTTATGRYLHDRASLVWRILIETSARRQRFWPE